MLLLDPTPEELRTRFSRDWEGIVKIANAADVRTLSVSDTMKGSPSVYYRDSIHISETGQRLYAEFLFREVLDVPTAQSCGSDALGMVNEAK
jgi:hypothetical protein